MHNIELNKYIWHGLPRKLDKPCKKSLLKYKAEFAPKWNKLGFFALLGNSAGCRSPPTLFSF